MAINQPPTITPGPTAPQRGDKSTFSNRVDAFVTWLIAVVSQFAAVATNVYNNALEALGYATAAGSSATAAAASAVVANAAADAAAVTTGATLWVSGQTVAQDAAKISPINRKTYRRKTPTGGGTTDPALDTSNYVLLSADATSSNLLATATVSSPVVAIDFLNIFTVMHDSYEIYIKGLTETANANSQRDLMLRLAVGGSATGEAMSLANAIEINSLGVTGVVSLINVRSSGKMQIMNGSLVAHRAFDSQPISYGGARNISTNPVVASGFRLYWSDGGTFSAGSIEVHGIKNS